MADTKRVYNLQEEYWWKNNEWRIKEIVGDIAIEGIIDEKFIDTDELAEALESYYTITQIDNKFSSYYNKTTSDKRYTKLTDFNSYKNTMSSKISTVEVNLYNNTTKTFSSGVNGSKAILSNIAVSSLSSLANFIQNTSSIPYYEKANYVCFDYNNETKYYNTKAGVACFETSIKNDRYKQRAKQVYICDSVYYEENLPKDAVKFIYNDKDYYLYFNSNGWEENKNGTNIEDFNQNIFIVNTSKVPTAKITANNYSSTEATVSYRVFNSNFESLEDFSGPLTSYIQTSSTTPSEEFAPSVVFKISYPIGLTGVVAAEKEYQENIEAFLRSKRLDCISADKNDDFLIDIGDLNLRVSDFEGNYSAYDINVEGESKQTAKGFLFEVQQNSSSENVFRVQVRDYETGDINGTVLSARDDGLYTYDKKVATEDDVDNLNDRIDTVNTNLTNNYYTKTQTNDLLDTKVNKVEEHSIVDTFATRITASDSTNSKYEIPDGSVAYPKRIGGMSYKSENLLDTSTTIDNYTTNGITFTKLGDGGFEAAGTNDGSNYSLFGFNSSNGATSKNIKLSAGTYTMAFFGNLNNNNARIVMFYTDETGSELYKNAYHNTKEIITLTQETMVGIYIRVESGATVNNIIYPYLVKGEAALTEFEPYYEGIRDSIVTEIKSIGSNLFNPNETENIDKNLGYVSLIDNGIRVGIKNSYTASSFVLSISSKNSIPIDRFENGATYRIMANVSSMNNIDISGTRIVIRGVNYLGKYTYYQVIDNIFSLSKTFSLNFDETIEFIEVNLYCGYNTNSVTEGQYIDYTNVYLGLADETRDYVPYWEETLKIPEQVQALDGYGLGINEEYHNYIDYDRKVFVKKVEKYIFTGNESFMSPNNMGTYNRFFLDGLKLKNKYVSTSCGLMADYPYISNYTLDEKHFYVSGGTLVFFDESATAEELAAKLAGKEMIMPLVEPIETDISEYLSEYSYKVDNLGIEIAVNEYNQAVPTTIDYNVSINEQVIENSDNIAKIKDNLIEIEEKFDDYLPLSGGRIDGNLGVGGTLSANELNLIDNSFKFLTKFISATKEATLPNKSGTIAFTDDIQNAFTQTIIDIQNGITEEHKQIVSNNPSTLIRYNEYVYVPNYAEGQIPSYYSSFAVDEGIGRNLQINWSTLTVEENFEVNFSQTVISIEDLTNL